MINKEQFEKELEAYRYYSFLNKTSFDYYKLIGVNSERANKYAYSFGLILDSLQFSFIVSTAKFINKNESGKNYYKFIEVCKCNIKYFADINEAIKKCNEFEKFLNDIQEKVNSIKELRDKIYAHSDSKYFTDPKNKLHLNINYGELDDIIHKCYNFVIRIYKCYIPLIDNNWLVDLTAELTYMTN